MGRSPCCDKVGLKKGPWTPEEDQKLLAYIEEHGHGNWRALPTKAGLQRCGKSCRLRWTNYLRPDIKRGKFSLQEEQTIIQLHALLGNRWSAIATHLPKRTDNEIKNYWNTHLKKRLAKMGIDPVTHKPKNDALHLSSSSSSAGVAGSSGGGEIDGARSKSAANLSHMAQWESARLEAEARLARQSKSQQLRSQHNVVNNCSSSSFFQSQLHHFGSLSGVPPAVSNNNVMLDFPHYNNNTWSTCLNRNVITGSGHSAAATPSVSSPPPVTTTAVFNRSASTSCLDVVRGGNNWGKSSSGGTTSGSNGGGGGGDGGSSSGAAGVSHHSPTSTLSFSENATAATINGPVIGVGRSENSTAVIEFMGNNNSTTTSSSRDHSGGKEERVVSDWKLTGGFGDNQNNNEDDQNNDEYNNNDGMENSMSGNHQQHGMGLSADADQNDNRHHHHTIGINFMDGFTELLLSNFPDRNPNPNPLVEEEENDNGADHENDMENGGGGGQLYDEDNKSYWNSILNLVNSSPSSSPLF